MRFSIIIPTCNRNDLLAKCLDQLCPGKQNFSADKYEVIVTDDGTGISAKELIETRYPWAHWIQGPRKGPAANRNHGAKSARGEWLVFIDDDCLPDKTILWSYDEATQRTNAQVLEGRTSACGIRHRVDLECPANETGGYLWSCNMAVRKTTFIELNGFDESFPGPAMEDVDFRIQLLKSGKSIEFVPKALVLHPWRPRKGMSHVRLSNESVLYLINKHPEQREKFTFFQLALGLARKIFSHLPQSAMHCKGRGLIREIFYSVYSTCSLFIATKRYRNEIFRSPKHTKS